MNLKNLDEIFNNKFIKIPDYQRGYSWGEEQLEYLWEDIALLKEANANHYTGMLTVKEVDKSIEIIDGQQRLTTLIILVKAIISHDNLINQNRINNKQVSDYIEKYLYKEEGGDVIIPEARLKYLTDKQSNIYFSKEILQINEIYESLPIHSLYTRNLERAKDFFIEKLKSTDKQFIESLLKKVTENLLFNYYQLDHNLNEFVVFETMNNRGIELSTLELLKNRLLYLSTLLPNTDSEEQDKLRLDINNSWKTVYEYLGKNASKPINDDDFLKDHWVMNFKYDRKKSRVYRNFLLKEHFTTKNLKSTIDIEQYKATLSLFKFSKKESETQLNQYINTIQTGKTIQDYVLNIQQSVRYYYYIKNPLESSYNEDIKLWLSKINRMSARRIFYPLLMAVFYVKADESLILRLLERIERFIFAEFYFKQMRSNYKNTEIYSKAREIFLNPIIIEDFVNDDNFWKPNELNIRAFDTKINDKSDRFYKWQGLKYFLYEYELFLQEQHSGNSIIKVKWESVNTESIEHIFPQNPDKDSDWNNYFKDKEQKEQLNDIGNLLLLSTKKNQENSNSEFEKKREKFKTDSYSAIEVAHGGNWTPKRIDERNKKLIEFMNKRWQLDLDLSEL